MEHRSNRFLADLTTSEGQLPRFTQICHALREQGKLPSARVAEIIKYSVKLTNIKVIRRHIHIMVMLSLIDLENGLHSLSSEGRALSTLTSREPTKSISLAEKIFYLRLLTKYIPTQFISSLIAISENQEQPKEQMVRSYGKRLLSQNVSWQSLENWRFKLTSETDDLTVPRKLQNSFDCLFLWLRQLGLVTSGLEMTSLGQRLSELIHSDVTHFISNILWAASAYVCGEPGCLPEFDYENETERQSLLALLNESYHLFAIPTMHVSNLNSMRLYVCIKLMMENRKLLEESRFDQLIRLLSHERIVDSLMTDRDGKLAYISLEPAAR